MISKSIKQHVALAVNACEDRHAEEIAIIKMEKSSSAFTDYFLICSGSNPRQVQAIANSVEESLKAAGVRPNNIEGYKQAEWILLDYVDFVVHIFSEVARKFYDLERLWKSATRLTPDELMAQPSKKPAAAEAKKTAVSDKTSSAASSANKTKASAHAGATAARGDSGPVARALSSPKRKHGVSARSAAAAQSRAKSSSRKPKSRKRSS